MSLEPLGASRRTAADGGPRRGALPLIAALWGFAEATLFVIVPDVLVSGITLRQGLRAGLAASVIAALAAALGGLAMYLWAASDPAMARSALVWLPAIDAGMIDRVAEDYRNGGYGAMLIGAFTGIPYKIYAVLAGEAGVPLWTFVALTPLIRLPRFMLTAAVTALVGRALQGFTRPSTRLLILAGFWCAFYAWYFGALA